ncbi:leucine-rich repeat domain-containing protein [Brachyspira hampsonii]|uniref:leucine-rich repeat domain-containing protein n=1 Tax=Brachyspira hampsonii TaxID=1287055 RepID=UPI003592F06C
MKYINFGLNPLDEFPIKLLSCTNLEHINMSLNNIKSLPIEITNLKKLKILDITRCPISKSDSVLKKLKNNGVKLIL